MAAKSSSSSPSSPCMFLHIPPLWQAGLASAIRTAIACTIVGCVTLFGPNSIQTLIGFPAFSYVSLILIIINDATFGDTFRSCWLSLYATIQAIGPAMLTLWAIGPTQFSKETISLAVAMAAFVVVVLPSDRSTHLIAKRISLGQIVLVYVIGYAKGVQTDPIMHCLRLAASTALGVIATLLALLLPYPRLATYEVKQNYRRLGKNTLKRMKLIVKAICEEDKNCAVASISHAKSLVTKRTRLLQLIMRRQDALKWERPLFKVFGWHYCSSPEEKLQEIDTNLRGMQLALSCTNSFPVNILNQDLKNGLSTLEEHVTLTIKHSQKHNLHVGSLTVPESSTKTITQSLQSLHTIPTTHQDLPIYFILFCAKLLDNTSWTESPTNVQDMPVKAKEKWTNWVTKLRSPNLVPAIKFSISLGLAVFMGLIYSKENGFWAGLPVAVSYVSGREATFRAANVKAQGTVIGTVYGVLGCFVFERFMPIRFLSLLPWFIFASFLQRSKMYGPAGGISAVIGAVLILGRKNFGPPSEFAIVRIIETFIGLSCSILVDLIFRPKRASKWAKVWLSQSLATLGDSIGSLSVIEIGSKINELENYQRRLKMQINEVRKFVEEAEVEPNFWFIPFNSACYDKLLGSLTRLVDLLHFGAHALKLLQQELRERNDDEVSNGKEGHGNMVQGEIEHVKEVVCSSIQCLEGICRIESLNFLEKELERKKISSDIESGKSTKKSMLSSTLGVDGIEKTIGSFLQRSKDVVDNLFGGESGENDELKSQVVLSLSALGFCLKEIMRETIEIQGGIKELVQWENPTSEINLYEISCKLHDLNN